MLKKKDLILSRMGSLAKEIPAQGETEIILPDGVEVESDAQIDPQPEQREKAQPAQGTDGKPMGFRLEEGDREIFRQKSRELDACGLNPSNNLIARAALRLLPRDHRLVEMMRELIAADGRSVRHKK